MNKIFPNLFSSQNNGDTSTYTNSYNFSDSKSSASTTFSQRRSKKMAAVVEDGVYILKEVDVRSDAGLEDQSSARSQDRRTWRVDSLDEGESLDGKRNVGPNGGYIV